MNKATQEAIDLFSIALAKECFYAGIKATNNSFNGEMPYVEIEHTEGIDIEKQIDKDSAVGMLFIHCFEDIVNKVVEKVKTGQAQAELEIIERMAIVVKAKFKGE
jgi:hypothetical protein